MNDADRVDDWQVHDEVNDNIRAFNTREKAEKAASVVRDLGGDDAAVSIYPPKESPHDDATADGGEWTPGDEGTPAAAAADPTPAGPIVETPPDDDLPERSVSDDPLTWLPGHFIDTIDGTPAINRKGFEVLAHHYDISTTSTLEVPPEETGHEYVRVKATATTNDGRKAEAYGSAHVDRGDDPELLLEMADTRARKRALSIATGVGVVAVSELRNEVGA